MTSNQLREMALSGKKPENLSLGLEALWCEAAGEWERAHDLCERVSSPLGEHIHAYLHRVEGDYWNACYWYERAGVKAPKEKESFEKEWLEIATKALR